MFLILWFSFTFSAPKYSQLSIDPDMEQEEYDQIIKRMKDDPEAWCREEYDEDDCTEEDMKRCIEDINAFQQGIHAKSVSEVNDKLSQFSKDNEIIYIIGAETDLSIDLNKLKSQMIVSIFPYVRPEEARSLESAKDQIKSLIRQMSSVKLDNSFESYIKLSSNIQKIKGSKTKRDKKNSGARLTPVDPATLVTVSLEGNIKDKVSFLILQNGNYKFINNDLNVNSVYFSQDTYFKEDSKKIKSNNIVVHWLAAEQFNGKDHLEVNQYGIHFDSEIGNDITTVYSKDSWIVDTGSDSKFTIPYSYANTFNIVAYSSSFHINLEGDVSLSSYKPLNISLFDKMPFMIEPLQEKKTISITGTGWDNINKENRPKITLVFDPNKFDFNPSDNDLFKIEKQDPYVYKSPKKKGPNVGMIVGIVVACVVVVAVVVVVVVIVVRKKKGVSNS